MHFSDTLIGAAISGGVALCVGAASVFASHKTSKRAAQTENKKAEAEIQKAINDGFGHYLAAWNAERAELHKLVAELKAYIAELIAELRIRNLPVPQPSPGALTVIEGGKSDAAKTDHG